MASVFRSASKGGLPWCIALAVVGCSGLTDVAGKNAAQSGVVDPESFKTPAGARTMYQMAVTTFRKAFVQAQFTSGLLADELTLGTPPGDRPVDYRRIPGNLVTGEDNRGVEIVQTYAALQVVRTYVVQADGALAKYDPTAPAALRGEVLALAGYAELYLADLFCSGVPLSELEFEGDFTYKPGSTTSEVYGHAITWFDSALTLSAGSARIRNLARVGKGRALLALGDYTAAAQAVVAVPSEFRYTFPVFWMSPSSLAATDKIDVMRQFGETVADHEGTNGLRYRSGDDTRTAVTAVWRSMLGDSVYFPAKYGTLDGTSSLQCYGGTPCLGSTSPVTVASGVEARLIEAEAQLHANGNDGVWLTTLNTLRTSCTDAATCPDPAPAGTGGVGGLPPLADAGAGLIGAAADSARVDLLFAERAKWLFVDGHRQGDLRRLIRQYGRRPDQVYPTGIYVPGSSGNWGSSTPPAVTYGTDVTLPVPDAERRINTAYKGCFNRGA